MTTFSLAERYAAGSAVDPSYEPAPGVDEDADYLTQAPTVGPAEAVEAGYVIAPDEDGRGWTVLTPPVPANVVLWDGRHHWTAGQRDVVGEECATVREAWRTAADHLQDVLDGRWCDRCGDSGACPDCVGA